MPQTLSSRSAVPREDHHGLMTDMYTNADGKRVIFRHHKTYLDCACGSQNLDNMAVETHLVAEKIGLPTRHRKDCLAHPDPFSPLMERKRNKQIRRQKAEQKRRMKEVLVAVINQEMEVTAEPVHNPYKDCTCDLVELYEKKSSQNGERGSSKYATEHRRIKDDQIRMLGKPCVVHELCCEKCHYARQDPNLRKPQAVRADDSKMDLGMTRANDTTSAERDRNDASSKSFEPPGYSSSKLSARSASAAIAKQTSKRLKRSPKPAVKQTVQQDHEKLARDILRAAGIHPYLPPLNAHLNVAHCVSDRDPRNKRARKR